MTKFDKQYQNLIKEIMENGIEELNQRTGIKVKALPGLTIQTDLEKDGFPLLSLRELKFSFIPEMIWFLSGENDATWLNKYTKIWNSFTEKNGTITSAYGWRWRHHFDFDQLYIVLKKLKEDSSTRHGVIMMWSPKTDLIIPQKNVPCPYSLTLNIIGGRLHLHLIIRSNDMILGNPTDVAGFALLTHILAQELNIKPGILTVSISNAHIYENQYYVAEELLKRNSKTDFVNFSLPDNTYKRACKLDDDLIKELKERIIDYKPEEAIKNIPIAL